MEHATAMKEYAVERYLLGEMTVSEQDEFELHYFECAECADDLRAASAFLENLKAVAATEPTVLRTPAKQQRDWFGWLRWQLVQPALTAVLLIMTTYLGLVRLPQLEKAAHAVVVPVRVDFGTRGVEQAAIQEHERVQIQTTLSPSMWAPRYEVEVRPATGGKAIVFEVEGPPRERLANFNIPVPTLLPPGDYTVTLKWEPGRSESGLFQLRSE